MALRLKDASLNFDTIARNSLWRSIFHDFILKSSWDKKGLNYVIAAPFLVCFLQLVAEKKTPENEAVLTSLRPFLLHDYTLSIEQLNCIFFKILTLLQIWFPPKVDLSRDQRAGQVFLIRAFFFRGNLTHSTKASEKLYTPARMSDVALYSPMHRGHFCVKWLDPPRKKNPNQINL